MIDGSADFRRFLENPSFAADEQIAALDAILNKAGVAGTAAKFLKLVAAKRRLFALPDMIRDFNKLNEAATTCRAPRSRSPKSSSPRTSRR
jgi:ATP synthase F1 subcomplex delta subunit